MKLVRWFFGAALLISGVAFSGTVVVPELSALRGSGETRLVYGHVAGLFCGVGAAMFGWLLLFSPESFKED